MKSILEKLLKINLYKIDRTVTYFFILSCIIFLVTLFFFFSVVIDYEYFNYNLLEVLTLLLGTFLLFIFSFNNNKNANRIIRIEQTCNVMSSILVDFENDELNKKSFLFKYKKITNNYQLLKTLMFGFFDDNSLLEDLDSKISSFSDYVEKSDSYNDNLYIIKDDKYISLLLNIESSLNMIIQKIYKK